MVIACFICAPGCIEEDKTAETACAEASCPPGTAIALEASSMSACEADLQSNVLSGEEGASAMCFASGECYYACSTTTECCGTETWTEDSYTCSQVCTGGGCGDGVCNDNEVCNKFSCGEDEPECDACKEDCCSACGDDSCVVPETSNNCDYKNYCPNDCGEGTKECPPKAGGTTTGGIPSCVSDADCVPDCPSGATCVCGDDKKCAKAEGGTTGGKEEKKSCENIGEEDECDEGDICTKLNGGTCMPKKP
jgi:hypothetical protein